MEQILALIAIGRTEAWDASSPSCSPTNSQPFDLIVFGVLSLPADT